MSVTVDERLVLPLLTPRGSSTTRATETVRAPDGSLLAELSLASDLHVGQALAAQAAAPPLPDHERVARLALAAEHFLDDRLGGLDLDQHLRMVSAASGHGPQVAAEATRAVATALVQAPQRADRGRPTGSLRTWQEVCPGHGSGVWTRRGRTLAAVLSGNSPTIQAGWLQALALGYRVAVRPSRREPFTALRTVLALRAAGFRDLDATFLPTGHAGVPTLLRRADLGFVYGGDDVVEQHAGSAAVKPFGPGRSRTVVVGGVDGAEVVSAVADAVSRLSGAGCVNTTSIHVGGDHAAFATRLGEELARRAERRRAEGDHLGPLVDDATATALVTRLRRHPTARPVIALDEVATPWSGGGSVLGPAVMMVDDPAHDALNDELPFPCAWVAPWRPQDGIGPLRGALVVDVVGDDPDLVDALLDDPSVRNVHVGVPTSHSDGLLPHEDFLGTFLMRNKAVVTRSEH